MSQEIQRPKLILIADSEGKTLFVQRLKDLLEREGYMVHIENDGFDTLKWLEDNIPDLILIDLSLPRLMGLDLIKIIRFLSKKQTEYRKIVITAILSGSDSKSLADAVNSGARFTISKPWQIADLMHRIKKVLSNKI
ncbi:MAG: response regulator [Patescibacteria group bacterium]|nr:response regulator [Patescibacteria group bacterium]